LFDCTGIDAAGYFRLCSRIRPLLLESHVIFAAADTAAAAATTFRDAGSQLLG